MGSLRDREVACSASDRQGSNFESCVWRTVSSQSSHHPQEVLLAQFSLYVHKGGLKPDSFHFIYQTVRSEHSPLIGVLYSQDTGGHTCSTGCLPNAGPMPSACGPMLGKHSIVLHVYKYFVGVTSGFIEMLIKNICKNIKILKKIKT